MEKADYFVFVNNSTMRIFLLLLLACLTKMGFAQSSGSRMPVFTMPEPVASQMEFDSALLRKGDTLQVASLGYFDRWPSFPGDLRAFLKANINWPSIESACTARLVRLLILKDGTIKSAEVAQPYSCPKVDSEILRVITLMPSWKAGEKDGKRVNSYIMFRVSKPEIHQRRSLFRRWF